MNLKLVFKLTTLFSALALTVYSMYLLNTGHSTDFMVSMGLGTKGESLNWCTNRLVKLESAQPGNDWLLEESNQQWMLSIDSAQPKRLEYLDVEKWLAQYCILHIQVYRSIDVLDMALEPFAKATFNDGSEAKIVRLGKDVYQINEVIFKSVEMESALNDLRKLLKI